MGLAYVVFLEEAVVNVDGPCKRTVHPYWIVIL